MANSRRQSTVRTRISADDRERIHKVLGTVEARLRRVAGRRESRESKRTYRAAADLVHNIIGKPRGRRS